MVSSPATRTELLQQADGLSSLIGNTPLLVIELLYHGEKCTIYPPFEVSDNPPFQDPCLVQ